MISKEVPISEIKGERIQKIIASLKEAMNSQTDAVAIAAPQIGEHVRVFIISGKVDALRGLTEERGPDIVCINPKITRISRKKQEIEEGCLSVRFLYGKVKRTTKATIEAYDEEGRKVRRDGVDLLAQIFQHEIDHLNGILFIDKAHDLEEIPPAPEEKLQ